MSGAVILSVSHAYAASPERLSDAWLDPAIVPHFLFATPDGEMNPQWAAYEAQTRSGWTMILDSLDHMMETKHD